MQQTLINKLKKINAFPYLIMGIMALILAQIAPYNSTEIQNFGLRAFYWLSIILVSRLAWELIEKSLVKRLTWHYFFIGALANLLMSIPLFLFILLINKLFYTEHNTWLGLLYFWLKLALTCLSIYILIYIAISQSIKNRKAEMDDCPPENTPHFLKDIGGDLLYIKSEDHYLRIQTTAENKLILYKLSDAIKQLETSNIQGMLAHRSHWVAKSAIKSHVKDGRKNQLALQNGEHLPVSATYLKQLKTAGYI